MKYVYPPRPVGKTIFSDLHIFESSGDWIIQRKYNGTRNLIFRDVSGNIRFFNRHGKEHSRFKASESMISTLNNLAYEDGKAYVFDGELMNKNSDMEPFIIIFDILFAGKYLFNRPNQMERLDILRNLCGNPMTLTDWGFLMAKDVYLAHHWEKDFLAEYQKAIKISQIEGLVLRKKSAGLDNFGDREYCTQTQIRCRKQIENGYNF